MSNDLRRKTVTLETDIGCLHRRNLRPTRNAANCEPINVTTPAGLLSRHAVQKEIAASEGGESDADEGASFIE
ncbi:hypothetical protein ACQZ4O_26040 [Agrobacterium vitis]|uniref:hypothetical protein n=1 Tax=Allorhizobium ampelinum TaxID=3025782 RepID=UPI001FCC7D82|nr:hypothetical protein [Allorhizobium ampelinum]